MDSNQKPLPSPPPPPPPPSPPKNGNTRGGPPLVSMQLHDEGDGGTIGVGDMDAAALRRGSPRATCHETSRSGRHELSGSGHHELSGSSHHKLSGSGRRLDSKASSCVETKMPLRSLVGCPGSDEATAEQYGLPPPPRRSREVARLKLPGLGTIAMVNDRPYACAVCSMTFGRETTLGVHMRSHKRDHLSSDSEEDAPTPKRRRKKRKSKLRTVKPLEATWGNHARRNGSPRDPPAEVIFSGSESDATVRNIAVAMHDSNNVAENDRSGNGIPMIIIDDDDDDANPVIPVAGPRGARGPTPDAAAALAMAPAPAVAVATRTPAPHAATASVNTEGAPAAASTTAMTIPPTPACAAAATVTRAPLATAVSVATQTAPDLAKGNNGSGQAGARYRYGGNGKVVARNSNSCGKSLGGNGNVNYGEGVAGYSDADYRGKGVAGCSSGRRTYNTSTVVGSESNQGCGKVYSCPESKNTSFSTLQALGGYISSHHRIMEKKDKRKLDLQTDHPSVAAAAAKEKTFEATGINNIGAAVDGPPNTMCGASRSVVLALPAARLPIHQQHQVHLHKCKVCNHVCQTGQELNFHMMSEHLHSGVAAAAKETTFEATGTNNIGASVDDPYNTMGWRFLAGASGSASLALPASLAPVHQSPHRTMAMAGNPMIGHFSAANTSTGWSLPGTTSSILPAIPLHNQELNPPEQIAAVVPGNHGHRNINPALFSFSRRREKNPLEEIAIACSSSTPRPGHSEAIGINNYSAGIDAPANTMGRRLPFFIAGRSDSHAFPVSRPVHHPTPEMAMDGNPLTSHFPAAIYATGRSFPATASSSLPAIPLQNPPEQLAAAAHGNHGCRSTNPLEEITVVPSSANPLEEITVVPSSAIDALTIAMSRLPFFPTGRSAIHGPPVSMPVHQPTQGMTTMPGNPVTGHFPADMAANDCSFPETTSSVLPAIPLQTQEENPPQGRVVPANGEHPSTYLFGSNTFPTFASQNQAENAPEETVPGNNGGSTIRLFGTNIVEGQKEVKEPNK